MNFFNKVYEYYSKIQAMNPLYTLFVTGFYLPTVVCIYKSGCAITGKTFLLPYISFFFIDNKFWEPIVFFYLPALVLLYFLHTDIAEYYSLNGSFFIKMVEKSRVVPVVFCKMSMIECYFYKNYKNKLYCIFFLIPYFLGFLYGLYKGFLLEVLFLFFPLLIIYYVTFRMFFHFQYEKIIGTKYFFHTFLEFHDILINVRTGEGSTLLVFICGLIFLFLCRQNNVLKFNKREYEKKCQNILRFFEKKILY